MHCKSALKSGYKCNFQFAGEKIGRKSPEEHGRNPLYVHYQCSLYFSLAHNSTCLLEAESLHIVPSNGV